MNRAQTTTYRFSWYWNVQNGLNNELVWRREHYNLEKAQQVSKSDQLPIGLIAQLIEHCIGIADVIGSNLIQTLIFFQALINNGVSYVYNYDDESCLSYIPLYQTNS